MTSVFSAYQHYPRPQPPKNCRIPLVETCEDAESRTMRQGGIDIKPTFSDPLGAPAPIPNCPTLDVAQTMNARFPDPRPESELRRTSYPRARDNCLRGSEWGELWTWDRVYPVCCTGEV